MCRAVFTVLPYLVLRYRQMCPEVARNALLATHGGLCALGPRGMVTVLARCGLPLPTYFLADEKHSHCLTDKGKNSRAYRVAG